MSRRPTKVQQKSVREGEGRLRLGKARGKTVGGERELGFSSSVAILQTSVLGALLSALGALTFHLKYGVLDLDVWLHLKAGDWIIQHHAMPHTDPFSRTAAGRPWIAYSWIYELLLSFGYRWFGLVGLGLAGTIVTLAVAYTVFWMVNRLSGRFWFSCMLAIAACYSFLFNIMPRPAFVSMALLCVMLTLILEARRSGRVQLLYWLPLIFLLWANVHIQFVYGIFLLGIFVAISLAERLMTRFGFSAAWLLPTTLPANKLLIVLAACVLATCIGPYSFHLYQVVFSYSKAKVPYSIVAELQPLDFRSPRHYVELLLAGAAFFAVGWNKKIDAFKLALLAACSFVAFRTLRDAWFICIPAAACIADLRPVQAERLHPARFPRIIAVAAVVCLSLLLVAPKLDFDTVGLDRAVRADFPADAADFIRQHHVEGPLYNTFRWGDFLMWYLPEYPVAIDGRTDLYGDEMVERFTMTAGGFSYAQDPDLNASRVVLLQRRTPLVKFLTTDPQFELVYQDDVAVVFRRR
jgi:hypothetical protein